MKKTISLIFILTLVSFNLFAQKKYYFPKSNSSNDITLEKSVVELSKKLSVGYEKVTSNLDSLRYQIYFQILDKKYDFAINSIKKYRSILSKNNWSGNTFFQYEIYTKSLKLSKGKNLNKVVETVIKEKLKTSENFLLSNLSNNVNNDDQTKDIYESLEKSLKEIKNDSISTNEGIEIITNWITKKVLSVVNQTLEKQINIFDQNKFIIQKENVKLKTGATLTLMICRNKQSNEKLPVILTNNIYAGNSDITYIRRSALNGYVGVIVNTRGKRDSKDKNEPFEHEHEDLYEVVDWISKQPWCNGSVGMYGGSYLGFSQWAATKKLHPALKTIVPQVAVGFGIDYPMHNNVFMNYMLQWIRYVTNNNLEDEKDFGDYKKWNDINQKWYKNGLSFRKLDSLAGKKDEIFQRWLDHPSFDSYWQKLIPHKEDFAKINIPILTTTGYYDDDQRGAIYYFNEHYKYNANPNHYLIVGPYDHGTAQSFSKNVLLGYKLDDVAKINIHSLTFEWFDYVLKGKKKPELLKNKINYQIMNTNKWHHVDNMKNVSNSNLKFYLNDEKTKQSIFKKPEKLSYISKEVDFKIREDETKYFKFENDSLNVNKNDIVLVSEELQSDIIFSGSPKIDLKIKINKKDVDVRMQLWHTQPNGRLFNLGENLFRASYSKNREKRELLTPNEVQNITMDNTYFVSKKIPKGSKLVLTIGVLKNEYNQINYGTGKDVSDESIEDAKEPLKIDWYNDSYIEIPILEGFE